MHDGGVQILENLLSIGVPVVAAVGGPLDVHSPYQRGPFTSQARSKSCASMATMTVLADMNTAPAAGGRQHHALRCKHASSLLSAQITMTPGQFAADPVLATHRPSGFESTDEPQYCADQERYNGKRADRQQVDAGEPDQTSKARIHPSQPFSGVFPRNTRYAKAE